MDEIVVYVPRCDIGLEGRNTVVIELDGLAASVEYAEHLAWPDVQAVVRKYSDHIRAVAQAVTEVCSRPPVGVVSDRLFQGDFWLTFEDASAPESGTKLVIPGLMKGNQLCEITWGYILRVTDPKELEEAIRDF